MCISIIWPGTKAIFVRHPHKSFIGAILSIEKWLEIGECAIIKPFRDYLHFARFVKIVPAEPQKPG